MLSHYAEPRYGLELFAQGAEGRAYLLKDRVHDGRELEAAIEVVARGGSMIDPAMVRMLLDSEERQRDSPLAALTPREREVLAAMAAGKSNAAIADELVLTKRAVEKHVGAIFLKLGLPGRGRWSAAASPPSCSTCRPSASSRLRAHPAEGCTRLRLTPARAIARRDARCERAPERRCAAPPQFATAPPRIRCACSPSTTSRCSGTRRAR